LRLRTNIPGPEVRRRRPPFLRIMRRALIDGECSRRGRWWREKNWNPTFSRWARRQNASTTRHFVWPLRLVTRSWKPPAAAAKFEIPLSPPNPQVSAVSQSSPQSGTGAAGSASDPGCQDGLMVGLGNPTKLREMQRMLHIGSLRHRTCMGERAKIPGDGAQEGPACSRVARLSEGRTSPSIPVSPRSRVDPDGQ
jgi:hypothetical protein